MCSSKNSTAVGRAEHFQNSTLSDCTSFHDRARHRPALVLDVGFVACVAFSFLSEAWASVKAQATAADTAATPRMHNTQGKPPRGLKGLGKVEHARPADVVYDQCVTSEAAYQRDAVRQRRSPNGLLFARP